MKSKGRKAVQAIGLLVTALYLIPAVLFGVWSLGTWVGLAAGLLTAVGARWWPQLTSFCRRHRLRWLQLGSLWLFVLFLAYSLVLCGLMVSGALRAPPQEAQGTVVVLGSKVNGSVPSADLQARINRAAAYLLEHPELPVVASGGQGAGEDVSEAEAIREGLIAQGVEASRIYLEDQSSDTQENIAFSREVMRENGLPEPMLIVTDEYHEFRANLLAEQTGIESLAVPGATPFYLLPACVAREVLALTKLLFFSWM